MLKEGVSNEEEISVLSRKFAFMYDEEAFSFITLVEILFWGNFENIVTHLESNWFNFWGNFFTWFLDVAESFISFAIKFWEVFGPLFSDLLENIWWNRKLRTSSINYSWIASILSWFLHCLSSIVHTLTFKSPSSKPIWEVFE